MMKSVFSILAFALLFPMVAGAQSTTLVAGARVRVTSPSDDLKRHVATVTEVRGDTIVVAGRSGSRAIGLGNVTSLEVSMGSRRHVLRDGAIGFGVGALLGAVLTKSASDDCPGGGQYGVCGVPVTESDAMLLGAAVYGTLGFITGAVVGAFDRSDSWERRDTGVRAAIGPSRSGGVQISMSRTF